MDRIVSTSAAQILKLWKPANGKYKTKLGTLNSKYSRKTNLLQAQNILITVSHNFIHNTLSLWNRLFCVKYTKILCSYVYADFLYTGNTYCPMMSHLYRIVDSGCAPLYNIYKYFVCSMKYR